MTLTPKFTPDSLPDTILQNLLGLQTDTGCWLLLNDVRDSPVA